MSAKLTDYVWDGCVASGMKLSGIAITVRLADFSSDESVCWPSVETIAHQLGVGPSTTRTAIVKPEKDGWLTRTQCRNGNRNAPNVYRLNVAKLQAAAFSRLSDSDAPKSDASKFDTSKADPSKSGKNGSFDPSESGGDPSIKSTQDPQVTSKPSCPVTAQPDPEVVITDQAILVLIRLNQISESRYQKSKTSLGNIRTRLRRGYSVADPQLAIDLKREHWHEDDEQCQYMRSGMLSGPKKLKSYLQSATHWEQKERPKRADQGAKECDVMTFDLVDTTIPEGFRGRRQANIASRWRHYVANQPTN